MALFLRNCLIYFADWEWIWCFRLRRFPSGYSLFGKSERCSRSIWYWVATFHIWFTERNSRFWLYSWRYIYISRFRIFLKLFVSRQGGVKSPVSWVFEDLTFKRSIFQTFRKVHCCTKSLFFELETSNFGYLLIFSFYWAVQSFSKTGQHWY